MFLRKLKNPLRWMESNIPLKSRKMDPVVRLNDVEFAQSNAKSTFPTLS